MTLQSLTFVIILGCISNINTGIAKRGEKIKKDNATDTIKKLVVDDYRVSNRMLGTDHGKEIKSGEINSVDKVWFTNDSLNQSLVFEVYTDDFREGAFLFYNNNIPDRLLQEMELTNNDGDLADIKQKRRYFKGFIRLAKKINKRYFITQKGFKLGSGKEEAIKVYGKPDKISKTGNTEIWEWSFIGDTQYDGKIKLRGKPLAEDSFGHQVTMFFQNDKLIGLILHNDIP